MLVRRASRMPEIHENYGSGSPCHLCCVRKQLVVKSEISRDQAEARLIAFLPALRLGRCLLRALRCRLMDFRSWTATLHRLRAPQLARGAEKSEVDPEIFRCFECG